MFDITADDLIGKSFKWKSLPNTTMIVAGEHNGEYAVYFVTRGNGGEVAKHLRYVNKDVFRARIKNGMYEAIE